MNTMFGSESLKRRLILIVISLLLVKCSSASFWYDNNVSDNIVWEYRIPVTITETAGVDRINEPVVLGLGYGGPIGITGGHLDLNKDLNVGSIRIVNPTVKGNLNEVYGEAVPYELDDLGDPGYSNEDDLVFLVNISANSKKTYYLYYSTTNFMIKPANYSVSDLNVTYNGKKSAVIENSRAVFKGFSTGYFTVHGYFDKKSGVEFANPLLGLDSGYHIDSSELNETLIRYDKYWNCRMLSRGPIRVQFRCYTSGLQDYSLEKIFTFYSNAPYYDTLNKIKKESIDLTNVRWNIYDMAAPFFTRNDPEKFRSMINGSGDTRSCYVAARDTENDGTRSNVFMIFGKNGADCYFTEDREYDYDLFITVVNLFGASSSISSTVRHLVEQGDLSVVDSEYLKFMNPLVVNVETASTDENLFRIMEPNQSIAYDIVYNKDQWITVRTAVNHKFRTADVKCSIFDSNGRLIEKEITLYNDGTHGDSVADDDFWTNNQSHLVTSYDPTGVWTTNCTETGSQSIPTQDSKTFYMVYKGGYRKIDVFNLYCRASETYKNNPAVVRPGGSVDLRLCMRNVGMQDESNLRVTIPKLMEGWNISESLISLLKRGDEIQTVLTLNVPYDQPPISKGFEVVVFSNDIPIGVGSVDIKVVTPEMKVLTNTEQNIFTVKTQDADDNPVADADIIVTYPSGAADSGKTNANGVFKTQIKESGEIKVSVERQGFIGKTIKVIVQGDEGLSYWYILPLIVTFILLIHLTMVKKVKLRDLF